LRERMNAPADFSRRKRWRYLRVNGPDICPSLA
jgi:hypothetical protein